MLESSFAVDHVSVSFGPKTKRVLALTDVTLSLVPGELTLIMGPSGSGKTTLLSLLGCLLTPDRGSVFVGDIEVTRLSEAARMRLRSSIGFIFQSFRLFHSLPAIENVLLSAEIRGNRRRQTEAARSLLDRVGLASKGHLKPDALSGGEKQRVAICRALLSNPSLILADEPTASLDFDSGQIIRQLLRSASRDQQRTVVVVSHDSRWKSFADRVVILEDGRIVSDSRSLGCEESSFSYHPVEA